MRWGGIIILQIDNFDPLKMYYREDYTVNEDILIHQPTMKEIRDYGEAEYFTMIHDLCAIPSDMKYPLSAIGVNYTEISDFAFFSYVSSSYDATATSILFDKGINFAGMSQYVNKENGELVLIDTDQDLVIDPLLYQEIVSYIRQMHFIYPKVEKPANKATLEILIEEDRVKREIQKKQKKGLTSTLLPQISTLVCQGWNLEEIDRLGIYAFMESVSRVQAISLSNAIMSGMYVMADLSKSKGLLDKIDMFRDLSEDRKKSPGNMTVTEN